MEPVRLAELCAATSLFTDLGTGQPSEHGLGTCLVAMRLADSLAFEEGLRREVLYVSLLRFLGCTADAHRVAALGGGDEIRFLAGMAPVTMGFPSGGAGPDDRPGGCGATDAAQAACLAGALTNPQEKERLLDAHCEVAAHLALRMGLPGEVSAALEVGYARWY